MTPSVRLLVGGHASRVQNEAQDLAGYRMFTAAHPAQRVVFRDTLDGTLDSGAFTDPPHKRLTPDRALDRQLAWETHASDKWGMPFRASGLVSYDRLIDEKWIAGKREKRRWSVAEGESAVGETVVAAQYLASQRATLTPRRLILSCQGVDAYQYQECVTEVLKVATPDDWIGLGGWCILGMRQTWMPTFWQAMRLILPQIAVTGVRHIHIFGVLFLPALGGLAWLADQHELTVSTDSTAPVLACTWANWKKAGVRERYWRDNVNYWVQTLANLRDTPFYKEPPVLQPVRQETFW
jgi:hypothetical protein